jgi:hypothetical protein
MQVSVRSAIHAIARLTRLKGQIQGARARVILSLNQELVRPPRSATPTESSASWLLVSAVARLRHTMAFPMQNPPSAISRFPALTKSLDFSSHKRTGFAH